MADLELPGPSCTPRSTLSRRPAAGAGRRRPSGCASITRSSARNPGPTPRPDGTVLGQQVTAAGPRRTLCAGRQGGLSVFGADECDSGQGGRRQGTDHGGARRRAARTTSWCWRRPPGRRRSRLHHRRRPGGRPRWPTARETVPQVDKIVGPGNAYVATRQAPGVRHRRHRHGRRAVGNPRRLRRLRRPGLGGDGPVFAGRARRTGAVDPDLHRCRFPRAVQASIDKLLPTMPRRDVIASLTDRGALILVRDLDEACRHRQPRRAGAPRTVAGRSRPVGRQDPPRRRHLHRPLHLGIARRLLCRARITCCRLRAARASRRRSASTTSRSAPA